MPQTIMPVINMQIITLVVLMLIVTTIRGVGNRAFTGRALRNLNIASLILVVIVMLIFVAMFWQFSAESIESYQNRFAGVESVEQNSAGLRRFSQGMMLLLIGGTLVAVGLMAYFARRVNHRAILININGNLVSHAVLSATNTEPRKGVFTDTFVIDDATIKVARTFVGSAINIKNATPDRARELIRAILEQVGAILTHRSETYSIHADPV